MISDCRETTAIRSKKAESSLHYDETADTSKTRRTSLYTIGLYGMHACEYIERGVALALLAARAPGRRGHGRGGRRHARAARHGGELLRGRRVRRALLPRAPLHHEARSAGSRGSHCGGGGRVVCRLSVRAQHVAEVTQ